MTQRRQRTGPFVGWIVLGLTLAAHGGSAADGARPAPTTVSADAELLEFLGGSDPAADSAHPDDGSWIEYLSQTDINRVARPRGTVVRASAARIDPGRTDQPAQTSQQ